MRPDETRRGRSADTLTTTLTNATAATTTASAMRHAESERRSCMPEREKESRRGRLRDTERGGREMATGASACIEDSAMRA